MEEMQEIFKQLNQNSQDVLTLLAKGMLVAQNEKEK